LRELTGQEMELSKLSLDGKEIKGKQRDKAVRNVKAALVLDPTLAERKEALKHLKPSLITSEDAEVSNLDAWVKAITDAVE